MEQKYTVDVRGEQCPIPVVKTKKVLDGIQGDAEITVLVDNETAVQKGVCCPVEDRTRRPDPDHKIPNAGCFPLAWNSDKFLIHVVPGDGGTAQIIDQVQQD